MKGYLGIDVSKGYADFVVLNSDKEVMESVFQLDDTRSGHDHLRSQLDRLFLQYGWTGLDCGVESTGGFENNWYGSLLAWSEELPIRVVRLNPNGVKKHSEASLHRNVTDGLSAQYIAEYLIRYPDRIRYGTSSQVDYSVFRSLHRHIFLLKKQQTQCINQLKALLYSAFPELVRYCKDSMPNWVLTVLKTYPSVSRIAELEVDTLSLLPHVTAKRADKLIRKARESVSSRDHEALSFLVASLAGQIQEKKALIAQHKKQLAKHCTGPEVDLLTSIIGIGTYSAASVMVEVEDILRFPSPKHLVSYYGVHPEIKESGDKKGRSRMSKKGRSSMRAILYMCARSAVVHDPHIKKLYALHRAKGLTHNQALGAIMQKLLRMIWGVLTYGKPYDAKVDQTNREQAEAARQAEQPTDTDPKRRFQDLDEDAPVTQKQSKTRKRERVSQVPVSETNAGSGVLPEIKIVNQNQRE